MGKNRFPCSRFTTLDGKGWIMKKGVKKRSSLSRKVESIKGEVARLRSA
jgi:hypothetical protein